MKIRSRKLKENIWESEGWCMKKCGWKIEDETKKQMGRKYEQRKKHESFGFETDWGGKMGSENGGKKNGWSNLCRSYVCLNIHANIAWVCCMPFPILTTEHWAGASARLILKKDPARENGSRWGHFKVTITRQERLLAVQYSIDFHKNNAGFSLNSWRNPVFFLWNLVLALCLEPAVISWTMLCVFIILIIPRLLDISIVLQQNKEIHLEILWI